jgi:hypothetical protein
MMAHPFAGHKHLRNRQLANRCGVRSLQQLKWRYKHRALTQGFEPSPPGQHLESHDIRRTPLHKPELARVLASASMKVLVGSGEGSEAILASSHLKTKQAG